MKKAAKFAKARPIDDHESMWEFIRRSLKATFIEYIPMEAIRQLPKFYMYLFGFTAEFLTFAYFVYLIWTVYMQGTSAEFISIKDAEGMYCKPVVKQVSGEYIADSNGVWVGRHGFDYSRGLYDLSLTEAALTMEAYQELLALVRSQTDMLGDLSMNHSLAFNLLVYMSWQFFCDTAKFPQCEFFVGQSFAFSANSQYMLALSYVDVTLSNQLADCSKHTSSTYDLANSENTGRYSYSAFISDSTCNTTADPNAFGYQSQLDGDDFILTMDVRAVADSMSLNFNLLKLKSLQIVANTESITFSFNGFHYVGNHYIDPWYVGMHPVFCVLSDNITATDDGSSGGLRQLCFITMGDVTGLPIFMHYGAGINISPQIPKPCSCSYAWGNESLCDEFNIISGMLFFNYPADEQPSMEETAKAWLGIVIEHGGAYATNEAAYNASWASASSTYFPDVMSDVLDPAWRESAYSFCLDPVTNRTCSVLAVNSYGDSLFDMSITPFMFLVSDGACSRQFAMSDDAYSRLVATPPTAIAENYYECTLDELNAMVNALGIASGNVTTLVPLAVFMLLPVMYLWLRVSGNVQPRMEYEQSEKDAALDLLALQILRIRDGRLRGLKKRGFLFNIAGELIQAAKHADGTAVDSDDSDDSDNDDFGGAMSSRRTSVAKKKSKNPASSKARGSINAPPPLMIPSASKEDSDDEEGADAGGTKVGQGSKEPDGGGNGAVAAKIVSNPLNSTADSSNSGTDHPAPRRRRGSTGGRDSMGARASMAGTAATVQRRKYDPNVARFLHHIPDTYESDEEESAATGGTGDGNPEGGGGSRSSFNLRTRPLVPVSPTSRSSVSGDDLVWGRRSTVRRAHAQEGSTRTSDIFNL